jgi:MOSC domain-containing protein YiiM
MNSVGMVKAIQIKAERHAPMVQVGAVTLLEQQGIEGDANASPLSLRQVCLTSAEMMASFGLAPGALRENFTLDGLEVDSLPSGTVLQLGTTAAVRITIPCEPCRFISTLNLRPGDLKDKRGVLGVVLQSGTVRVGDAVYGVPEHYPAISAIPYARFLTLLAQVPRGKVVAYDQILTAISVGRSYFRVLPNYIRRTQADMNHVNEAYSLHRIVDSKGHLLSFLPGQREMLQAEGVVVSQDDVVDMSRYGWNLLLMVW